MDLRKERDLSCSVARLSDSIGGSELEGKDGMLEDLRQMESKWKGIKAILSDWESERMVNKYVKAWLVELRDLAWEIEDLVGLYEYLVIAMQADDEEEDHVLAMQDHKEEEEFLDNTCDEDLGTPYLLEEDLDFGRWEPERWCSKTLFDRAQANGKRTEVSFAYKQNEVCLPQAFTKSTPIPDLPSLVKNIFRNQSPRNVFIDGEDRSSKVTCCFNKDAHHIHIHKSLFIGDSNIASRTRKQRETHHVRNPPVDPSLLIEISDAARKIAERFHHIDELIEALCGLANQKQPSSNNDDDDSSILYRQAIPTGSLPANRDKFIGRGKQMQEMVEMLIRKDVDPAVPEVIALVGMGGIGKTTLCQHIYNHPEIKQHFDLRGWVHVGESFQVLWVLNNIVSSFTKGGSNCSQVSQAQELLMEKLEGKRFLLVMDDVWCEKMGEWEPVMAPLTLNNIPGGGSKILITTRNQAVAEKAEAVKSIPLGFLSQKDGWYLFSKYANIGINDSPDRELVDIGKGIVGKCKGHPLAIKLMGSLMRNKGQDEDSWTDILKSDFSDLWEEGGGREILGPLYLSYLHLPSRLKACFKFFVFLDRYDSKNVQRLTNLWLAHNLIGEHYGKTWYREQGRNIIHHFASRSFLEIHPTSAEHMWIRVHDLVFDLAEYVAGSEFCIDPPLSDMPWTLPTEARHLRIGDEHSLTKFTLSSVGAMRTIELRAHDYGLFSYLPDFNQHANLRFLSADIKRLDVHFHFHCRHLRVLRIDGADIEVIPKSLYKLYNLIKLQFIQCYKIKRVSNLVGNLKNLRCLSFIDCKHMQSIPESVSKLTTLEELHFSDCRSITELPTGITRLVNLHSLDISGTKIDELPTGITRLVNLHSLEIYHTDITWMPLGLSNLIWLDLHLSNLRRLDLHVSNLSRLDLHLSNLRTFQPCSFSSYKLRYGKLHHLLNDLNSLNLKEEELEIRVGEYLTGEESEEAELEINGRYHSLDIVGNHREVLSSSITVEIILSNGDELLNDEQILRYLKPHNNIRELEICDLDSARLPIWMGDQSYHQLVSLKLDDLGSCKTLSPIHRLPSLRQLKIRALHGLENVVPEEDSEVIAGAKSLHPHQKPSCFPKLEILDISRSNSVELVPIYRLTSLQKLSIDCCDKLKSIEFVDPFVLNMEQHHDGGNSSLIITELIIQRCHQLCFSSNISVPPQSLKKVSIENCEKLSSWFQSEANSKWKDIIIPLGDMYYLFKLQPW